MRYIIYCDESDNKGRFYSNFYGGAIVRASEREAIEAELSEVKAAHGLQGEAKWTKIGPHNEKAYIAFVDAIFDIIEADRMKMRVMFTQNINQIRHLKYEEDQEFFKLYYQFLKHAFGLRYCNPARKEVVTVSVYLDDAPDTAEKLELFKDYLSSLSAHPFFRQGRIVMPKEEITEIDSEQHTILQAVDVILGSMQFRLNELHKEKAAGGKRRGKRTRAKERVYKHINARIRKLYPGFNIGVSTARLDGPECKWSHQYRHWCFVPSGSIQDRTRGKRKK